MPKLKVGDRYRYVGIGDEAPGNPETIAITSVTWTGTVGVVGDFEGHGPTGAAIPLTEVLGLVEQGIWESIPSVGEAEA